MLQTDGAAHERLFTVECHIRGYEETTVGTGNTRRLAEQEAARQAIERIAQAGGAKAL